VTPAHGLAIDTARFVVRAIGNHAAKDAAREFVEVEDSSIHEDALVVEENMWKVIRNLATDMETRESAYRTIADAKSAWRRECERIATSRECAIDFRRKTAETAERIAQATIIRDIFSYPFR
jgi:ferric-dicitrate binding protein FerR (iron transport regulator)